MIPNLLKLLWFLMLLCGLTAAILGWTQTAPPGRWRLVAVLAVGWLCWSYLTVRLFHFRKRLFNFLRRLLAGDYEAGIRTRGRFTDELSALEALGNQVGVRLKAYDRLRADRVSLYARMLDLIVTRSTDGLVTADVDKETFAFNPAAQKRLGINRKTFSFDSVVHAPANDAFNRLFRQATTGRKTNTGGSCLLQLPGMADPLRLNLLLFPLRDRGETVRFILISIDDAQPA